ncbi:alpha/beta fold hydrolase [Actinomadura sp. J1-007]|uniref:alpha/beta fold hydrolase n=1 Tax=Actinomadura sp. J1-007 TaxID=2661913 RepID=UPI0019D61F12|nr:alpha/beta fold hydrolase [Actinomadura sp. J1-007]
MKASMVEGPGSVSGAPHLPPGFTDTFTSRYVDTGDVRLHAVTGGQGPALLLLAGWPQSWYAWRLIMPALAADFQVVAVDPRGVGLSDKPRDGYDTGTLAADMVALMAALGHRRFSMVGHDVGMWTGYALAADHPERLERLAVAEAAIPGLSPSPPLFHGTQANDRLWHFAFNRLSELNELLIQGKERVFFGHQFATKAVRKLPDHAVEHYVGPSPPTPTPCAPASRSTAPSTPPSRRTSGARPGGWPFPSWRSPVRATPETWSRRPCGSPPTTWKA